MLNKCRLREIIKEKYSKYESECLNDDLIDNIGSFIGFTFDEQREIAEYMLDFLTKWNNEKKILFSHILSNNVELIHKSQSRYINGQWIDHRPYNKEHTNLILIDAIFNLNHKILFESIFYFAIFPKGDDDDVYRLLNMRVYDSQYGLIKQMFSIQCKESDSQKPSSYFIQLANFIDRGTNTKLEKKEVKEQRKHINNISGLNKIKKELNNQRTKDYKQKNIENSLLISS